MAPAIRNADGLSITLSNLTPAEPWVVVAVLVTKPNHRHRITFVREQFFQDVFCPEIVDALLPILSGFSAIDSVYSNPDLEIALPGLTLKQLRVIHSSDDDGARILIRFAGVIGNPHRAFLYDDGFSHPLDALASEVYRDALDSVLIPALNIVTVDETGGFDGRDDNEVRDAITHLRASKDRLLFQIELVKRELRRLESHTYSTTRPPPVLMAAEPDQEEFRSMRVIQNMD